MNDHFASNGIALGRVTNALRTWPGLLRFVTHQFSTGLGWLLLAVLLSVHVAGEWSTKTAGVTLVAIGSRWRFWLAKMLSVWLFMMVLTVVGASLLYLLRPTFTSTVGIPQPALQQGDPSTWHLSALRPDASWSSLVSSLGIFGLASLLWLVLSAAGTTIAATLRRPMVALVTFVAGLSLALAVAQFANKPGWTVIPSVNQLLRLQATPFGVRDSRLWYVPGAPTYIQAARAATPTSVTGVVVWACGLLALGVTGWVVLQRRQTLV